MSTKANIVNLRNVKSIENWLQGENNVYIGRPTRDIPGGSCWGNPYRLRIYKSRKKVIHLFKKHLQRTKKLRESVGVLKGKVLGCWCAPESCHGEVLHEAAGNQPVYQSSMSEDMATGGAFNAETLEKFKKGELIELVMQLQTEKEALKEEKESLQKITSRVVELERSQYLYEQYARRESVEVSGIPTTVKIDDLEDAVIDVYNRAKVQVFGRELRKEDISACHRVGKKKEVTIVRFVNRKWAWQGMISGKNLKGTSIYINNSFCPEFAKYGYYIRRLKPQLKGYRVRHGVYQVQLDEEGDYFEISHSSDFAKYGLDIEPFQKK